MPGGHEEVKTGGWWVMRKEQAIAREERGRKN